MSALQDWTPPAGAVHPVIRSGSDASVLEAINERWTELAVWRRRTPDYGEWLGALPEKCLPRLRWSGQARDVYAALDDACEAAETPDGLGRTCLKLDITHLAERMSTLLGSDRLVVRLDVSRGQPCPRWHRDAVTARLLCTLRGPGTEFRDASAALEPPELLRPEHGGEQSPDFSDGVMRRNQDLEIDRAPGSPHFALGCGEVGLVRGTNWAGADPMRLLHRSPPAMGDTARLLLVIDPVDPMSDEEDVRYPS